jgi:pantoate--beta-alanine ligase
MFIFHRAEDLRNYLANSNSRVGFVPTMGALHLGHISLIQASQKEHDVTVCSIFVNPTQFNDPADYEKYPITLESDIEALVRVGTDILYLPSVKDMYPDGVPESKAYPIGYLDTVLDGLYRPGHYNGVCTIVSKLLRHVQPHTLFLGEKDYQQCLVLKWLVQFESLPVQVETCPTLREPSGLAMSSRNERLSVDARQEAALIYAELQFIKQNCAKQPFSELQAASTERLASAGFQTEYFLLFQADTFQPLADFSGAEPMVVLIATFFHGVRLIDNLRLN